MTLLPQGVKVHLAFGFIDMRKGIDGLAILVQGVLRQDPFSGHLFLFRGRKPISSRSCTGMAPASPLHQAARARRVPVAVERRAGWDADAELGAIIDAD
jgi:transposase